MTEHLRGRQGWWRVGGRDRWRGGGRDGGGGDGGWGGLGFRRDITPRMENGIEKNIEHEMTTRIL